MILNKIEDPRDALARARRIELYRYAQANGVKDIEFDMPATLMRQKLRSLGLTRIAIPHRPLGAQAQRPSEIPNASVAPEKVKEVDADAELLKQWEMERTKKPQNPIIETMTYAELRKECKARGIATKRTDKIEDLRKKLDL